MAKRQHSTAALRYDMGELEAENLRHGLADEPFNWEIPAPCSPGFTISGVVKDLDRAQEFYAAVLGLEVGLFVDVLFLHGYLGMAVRGDHRDGDTHAHPRHLRSGRHDLELFAPRAANEG